MMFEDHLKYPVERLAALERDNHQCRYCERPGTTTDHIVPRAQNGSHHRLNLVAACDPCNANKDDRSLDEWLRILKTNPTPALRFFAQTIIDNIPGVKAQAESLVSPYSIAARALIVPHPETSMRAGLSL